VPPTPAGIAVGACSAVALFRFGLGRLDLILFVMGCLGLALAGLSVVVVAVVALVLGLRLRPRTGEARRVEAESPFRTGFVAPPTWFVPLVRCGWEWEEPEGSEVLPAPGLGGVAEDVVAKGRGVHARIVRRIVVEDAFGLSRLAFRVIETAELVVLPNAGQLRQMPVVRSLAGGDDVPHPLGLPEGDRVDMRRYAPGDPVRLVLWKTFARTRQLLVRVPERALVPARRTVGYLVAGSGDEPSAAAARVAVESGALGRDWVFGADGAPAATAVLDEALRCIAASAASKGDGALGLDRFLREADRFGSARVVLFVPPRAGPWIDRVIAVAARRPGGVEAVVGIDGVLRQGLSSTLSRVLLRSAPRSAQASARELDEVLSRLAAGRVLGLLVDRTTGRVFGRAHQKGLAA
jgi:hypothetical protein